VKSRAVIVTVPIDWDGSFSKKVVRGEIVDVAPHLSHLLTWIVHRSPHISPPPYRISNIETGMTCPVADSMTKESAIANAANYLKQITAKHAALRLRKVARRVIQQERDA
jgi:hypothetical protein